MKIKKKETYDLLKCPLCGNFDLAYKFTIHSHLVVQCQKCSFLMLNPQPSDKELEEIYSSDYFLGQRTEEEVERTIEMKRATARYYLNIIKDYSKKPIKRLLEIGCGNGEFLLETKSQGIDVVGIDVSSSAVKKAQEKLGDSDSVIYGTIENIDFPENSFDACILSDVLKHVRNPSDFLKSVHNLIKPNGLLFVSTPSLDGFYHKLLGERWMEFKPEHLFYFDSNTLQKLFLKTGYHCINIQPDKKIRNLEYIVQHFERFQVRGLTFLIRCLIKIMPPAMRRYNIKLKSGNIIALAQPKKISKRKKLSVVVPVHNEKPTFCKLMDSLIEKKIQGIDIEIIIVESNSNDGTRQDVMSYRNHPYVKIILEKEPKGKGHAVRTGLKEAKGDFILIQDADLEYDINDYDALLAPLLNYEKLFVLGSRHMKNTNWKIRQFEKNPFLAFFMNLADRFFRVFFNILYRQNIKDPTTMYKVFNSECLKNMKLESNRFDFDWEILAKLVRSGYTPLEIPVNYVSRSFSEGKKIRLFRDPLTWVFALIKYRFIKLN